MTSFPQPAKAPPIPEVSFYIQDHLGNTRILYHTTFTDCNQAAVLYHLELMADYYPFGKILREYMAQGIPEKFLTTQHERDVETGLDYRGARFYDSEVGRFLGVDPLAYERVWVSPYNYVQNNPILRIDPTGAIDDPIFDSVTGEFMGHYGDSDYNGEIMVMDRLKYEMITGGNDIVISYNLAEKNGTYLKDYIANHMAPQSPADISFLSNVYTNLIDQAYADGIIDYNSSKLEGGKINIDVDLDNTNPKAAAANSTFTSADRISIFLRSSTREETRANPYKEGTLSVWSNLTHAGDAINVLGIHEPLHRKYRGTDDKSHQAMNREILSDKKYKKALEQASQFYLDQAKTSAGYGQ